MLEINQRNMIGYNCEKKIMIQAYHPHPSPQIAPIKLISLYLINLDYSLMFKSSLVNMQMMVFHIS